MLQMVLRRSWLAGRYVRPSVGATLSIALGLGLAACGGGSSSRTVVDGIDSPQHGGKATVVIGTAPDSLDPQLGVTSQSGDTDWLVYTGLVTYRHAEGAAGTELIPGLATSLPRISDGGKTYELMLRRGLVYSNGTPVEASDFAYTIERMLKLDWGGKARVTNYVQGAAAFDAGKARSISGIVTDDRAGTITIRLTRPYGAFADVLAFPAAGLVPSGTPIRNLSASPPPGVGPYMITSSDPNRGWTLQRNPRFPGFGIPGIPAGHLEQIAFSISSNTASEAEDVLTDRADVFDAADTLPPPLLSQINTRAADRFAKVPSVSTSYFFFNTTIKPFNDELARRAVSEAIDRRAMVRLASGFLTPECFFIPTGLVGHPDGACPSGPLNAAPQIARAKQLVQQSGMAGAPVTVWGMRRSPYKEFVDYYANLLSRLGFKVTERVLTDAVYYPTIGNATTKAQTGFANWISALPSPSDFYLPLDANSIQPVNSVNFGRVNDPQIQAALRRLNAVQASRLRSEASAWQALDEYTASRAYVAPFGTKLLPKFFSDRLDFSSAIFHPIYYNDYTSLRLK